MNVLDIKNITKSFSDKVVLDNVSLTIKTGEILGLVGLNGTGKTTLIKIILDLIDLDKGQCFICGENSRKSFSRDNIFYLPEKFQPSQNLKVIEFFNIFTNKNFRKEDLYLMFDNLSLEKNILNKKIGNLSKGMTQKIGLIASMFENKKLIILDEPMSGLDPKARIQLKNMIINYKNKGNSVFFSSHILSDLDDICDKIAVLNDKHITFIGSSDNFKEKNKEVSLEKAFLKEINFQ